MCLPLAGRGMPEEYHFNIIAAAMEMLKESWRFWLRKTRRIYKTPRSFGGLQYLIFDRIFSHLVDLAQK